MLDIFFVGSVQHESLVPTVSVENDRTEPRAEWAKIDHLSNTYVDMGLRYAHADTTRTGKKTTFAGVYADMRLELMEWPMLGYESGFRGYGVGHLSVDTKFKWGDITVGDVYGQFGSGFILRLYEERSLGIDNALCGGKIELNPYKGINLTLLGGKQRRYWEMYEDKAWGFNYSKDAVLGADLELHLEQMFEKVYGTGANLMVGGSWVSKYQQADTLWMGSEGKRMPVWVGAMDVRTQFQMKGWSALVEYAYKANDPCVYNSYSYAPGHALMASLSYSRKGMSIIAQAKRTENMYFSSDRYMNSTSGCGYLNHLPAFANQHTYALASIYPYATQMLGEWAMQGEIRYTFARKTPMGGKYGTTLKLNGSHVRGLGETFFSSSKDAYYTDVNLELNKKITKQWTLNAMVMYQTYNKAVVEGHGDMVRSGIFVADAKYATSKMVQMRAELQYLYTKQDEGQRIFALYELSLNLPKSNSLMLSAQDQYVIGHGTSTEEKGENYYSLLATWNHRAHRLSLGYAKTRAGYNCSGGVCRYVPKQEGVQVTYNYTW